MNQPAGPPLGPHRGAAAAPPPPAPYPSRYRPLVRLAAKIDLVVTHCKILVLMLLIAGLMDSVPEFLSFLLPELSKPHAPTNQAVLAALLFQILRDRDPYDLHRTTDPGTTLARTFSEVWWLRVGYGFAVVYFVLLAIPSTTLELILFGLAYAAMLILIEMFYRELEGEVERERNAGGNGQVGGSGGAEGAR